MPSVPEVGWARREVGQAEIDHEFETHDLRQTARDIRVSGEITVYLERECEDSHDQVAAGVGMVVVEYFVRDRAQVIRDDDLLEHTPEDEPDTRVHLIDRYPARRRALGKKLARAIDRSGDELREERYEQREIEDIVRRLQLAPIYIDRVTHRFERIE